MALKLEWILLWRSTQVFEGMGRKTVGWKPPVGLGKNGFFLWVKGGKSQKPFDPEHTAGARSLEGKIHLWSFPACSSQQAVGAAKLKAARSLSGCPSWTRSKVERGCGGLLRSPPHARTSWLSGAWGFPWLWARTTTLRIIHLQPAKAEFSAALMTFLFWFYTGPDPPHRNPSCFSAALLESCAKWAAGDSLCTGNPLMAWIWLRSETVTALSS